MTAISILILSGVVLSMGYRLHILEEKLRQHEQLILRLHIALKGEKGE